LAKILTNLISFNSIHGTENQRYKMLFEPASHSYLGNDLEDVKKRDILSVNSIHDILLLPMRDVILFPGETIPLRIQNSGLLLEIRKLFEPRIDLYGDVHEDIHHIGIVNATRVITGSSTLVIGTTIEIRTKSRENMRRLGTNDEVILTGKGRHRFKVLKVRRQGVAALATVQILPEIYSCNPRFESLSGGVKPFPLWTGLTTRPQDLVRAALTQLRSQQQVGVYWFKCPIIAIQRYTG
jgi:Lon protease-like protein